MLDQIPLQVDKEAERIKEREDGERVGGGGDYYKHFHQRGVSIQGRPVIEGRRAFLNKSVFFSTISLHIKKFLCSNQHDKEGNKKIKSEQ